LATKLKKKAVKSTLTGYTESVNCSDSLVSLQTFLWGSCTAAAFKAAVLNREGACP